MEASWEEGEGGRNIPAFPLSLSDRQQCFQYVSPNLCIFGFLVSVLDKELTQKYLQTMTKIKFRNNFIFLSLAAQIENKTIIKLFNKVLLINVKFFF